MAQLWGGRFTGAADPAMVEFNASLRFDKRMAQADVAGSIAYAQALQRRGIVTDAELAELQCGLALVAQEWDTGVFVAIASDEDIHTANERRLGELIGTATSGKLHTGRSRNDQVATDMRLWLRDQIAEHKTLLRDLIAVLVARAERETDVLMPGYTHLQRAQPIRWAHFLLAYSWYLRDDVERLEQLEQRVNRMPLGAGALAGNPFAVDRDALCADLGFVSPIMNSLVAVSDRDFVVEYLSFATLFMVHLSRLSEDLILYSSAEFGFVQLADAYSTGSSLMPQKKNPDSLELIRGKCGRVFGAMTSMLMTLKGLPSTYNKDMQEDKEPLFDAVDTVRGCTLIATGVMSTLSVRKDRMRNALSTDMLTTDLAEYLVRKGVPFRDTHHIAGHAIRIAEERGIPLDKVPLADLQKLHPLFEADVAQTWDFNASVDRRTASGGTSASAVAQQIELQRTWLATHTKTTSNPTQH